MTLLMFTDITERKAAEQLEREVEAHKREFYRRTILAFTGGKLVIAEREEIVRLAGQEIAAWQLADVQDLGTMRDAVKRRLLGVGVDEQRVFDFVGSVVEAATNALKHASGGRATLHLNHESVLLVVSDGGAGIEALALPDVALTRGYSTTATLGMGYKVMLAFSDRVYLATGPDGTAVAIEMKLQPAPNADSAQLQKLSGW